MKKDTNHQEERKNLVFGYIKIIFLFLLTGFAILLVRNWYVTRVNYQLSIPIIKETLIQEVNGDEIYNYVRANENVVIYMGVVTDQKCREFEEMFNEIITEKNLETTITYLNLTEEKKVKNFLKEFNKFYDSRLNSYPALIVFEDGQIKNTLSQENSKLTNQEVITFLEENDIESEGM